MKSKAFIILTILFLIISCNKPVQKQYNLFDRDDRTYILKNNISEITEYEIGLDTSGNSLWKRISTIKLYDKKGNLIKTISPGYITKPWPKSSPEGLSMDAISYYSTISETNIPNGKVDTTYFDYDDNGNLLSSKNEFLLTYKYDLNNNEIEKCVSSEYTETVCNFKRFVYDENQRIKYSIDSSGARASRDGRKYDLTTKKSFFKYDKNGNVVFDGEYNRIFNQKGLLVKVYKFNNDNNNYVENIYELKYDNKNVKIVEKYTSQLPVDQFKKNTSIYSKKKYFYYDTKGLLIQEKTLNNKDKLVSLIKYEYKFNN